MTQSDDGGANGCGIVTLASPWPFAETVNRLRTAFSERGIKLFAVIDQQAEAAAAGLAMPPTTLILFGNPKAGTPLMLANPASGLDLPLKVLITETQPGRVTVSFNSVAYILSRHSLPATLRSNLAPAENLIRSVLQA